MTTYSVAEARNNLSKLIDQAERGETVEITRHGKPVVKFVALGNSVGHSNWREKMLSALSDPIPLPGGPVDGTALIRRMRDEGY